MSLVVSCAVCHVELAHHVGGTVLIDRSWVGADPIVMCSECWFFACIFGRGQATTLDRAIS